jgi:hypothetical protein
MIHNLPSTPAFRDSPGVDAAQEIALRVIVELPEWQFYQLGTAVLIAGHVAVTARHVLEEPFRRFGARQTTNGIEVTKYSVRLLQRYSLARSTGSGMFHALGFRRATLPYCTLGLIALPKMNPMFSGEFLAFGSCRRRPARKS